MDTTKHLEKAVELAGGQTELAAQINRYLLVGVPHIRQAHVWSWLNRSGRVPSEYAIPLQLAVNGAVKAVDICPDVFRPDIADLHIKGDAAA